MRLQIEGEMPHDMAAERAVVGSVIFEPKCYAEVAVLVAAGDFYHPAHQAIFDVMGELDAASSPVDALSIAAALKSHGRLEVLNSSGGVDYLQELQLEIVTPTSVGFHARAVARKAERRRWVAAAHRLLAAGLADGKDDVFLRDAECEMLALTAGRRGEGGPKAIKPVMADVAHELERRYERRNERAVTGIPSGLADVDIFTLGWQPGEVAVIAARPSMGKTSIAMGAAVEAARAGYPVLFFSLEMSRRSLVERVIAMESCVDSTAMRTGHLDVQNWVRLTKSFGRIASMPIWIDDEGGISIADIRSRARRWRLNDAGPNMPLIIVDYIGIVKPNNANPRNREREVAEVSADLKAMAKDMACPVIVLSQLNRSLESRSDKRPMLSDLRESGAIEQDADVIAFIYRDEVYHDRPMGQCDICDAGNGGVGEIIIAKQRNGQTGVAHVGWKAAWTKFVNRSSR